MKKYNFLIRLTIYCALAFLIIPEIIKKIAQKISPGGISILTTEYSGTGLLALVLIAVVVIKNYEKLKNIQTPKIYETIGFTTFAIATLLIFLIFQWARLPNPYTQFALAWTVYTAGMISLALAILGTEFFKITWKQLIGVSIVITAYIALYIYLDRQLAIIKMAGYLVYQLLRWIVPVKYTFVESIDAPRLSLENYSVTIGAPCSGIYSFILFTGIYTFVCWLDYEKINKKKAILYYIPGIIGAYIINVIRVTAILLLATYYSRDFAIGLFHSHAGWLLFTTYSLIYWYIVYPKILRKDIKTNKTKQDKKGEK